MILLAGAMIFYIVAYIFGNYLVASQIIVGGFIDGLIGYQIKSLQNLVRHILLCFSHYHWQLYVSFINHSDFSFFFVWQKVLKIELRIIIVCHLKLS